MEEKKQKKLELTNDVAFQRLFGMPGNERITKKMLEKLLKIKIEELTLNVNKRMYGEFEDDKVGRLDVKAVLDDGIKVIIEMQVAMYDYLVKRFLYYWAKTYAEDLKKRWKI